MTLEKETIKVFYDRIPKVKDDIVAHFKNDDLFFTELLQKSKSNFNIEQLLTQNVPSDVYRQMIKMKEVRSSSLLLVENNIEGKAINSFKIDRFHVEKNYFDILIKNQNGDPVTSETMNDLINKMDSYTLYDAGDPYSPCNMSIKEIPALKIKSINNLDDLISTVNKIDNYYESLFHKKTSSFSEKDLSKDDYIKIKREIDRSVKPPGFNSSYFNIDWSHYLDFKEQATYKVQNIESKLYDLNNPPPKFLDFKKKIDIRKLSNELEKIKSELYNCSLVEKNYLDLKEIKVKEKVNDLVKTNENERLIKVPNMEKSLNDILKLSNELKVIRSQYMNDIHLNTPLLKDKYPDLYEFYSKDFPAITKLSEKSLSILDKLNKDHNKVYSISEIKKEYQILGKRLEKQGGIDDFKKFQDLETVTNEIKQISITEKNEQLLINKELSKEMNYQLSM